MTSLLEIRTKLLDGIRAERSSLVLADIGCGQSPEDGFTGYDYHSTTPGVIHADLYNAPWPFADNSVDYFRASHFLEHVPDWDYHFSEVYRSLRMGGYYEIISPYYLNNRWWQDPDHKQPILHERFSYLSHEWRKAVKMDHYGAVVNFEVVQWFELLNEDFREQGYSTEAIYWHKRHSFNIIDDLALILKKLPIAAESEAESESECDMDLEVANG